MRQREGVRDRGRRERWKRKRLWREIKQTEEHKNTSIIRHGES